MRYLVRARVKSGRERALRRAIADGSLGRGSVAGGEYARNMVEARELEDGTVRWVEVCFCETPLEEERPYWEAYFDLDKVQDAHARSRCRDLNGSEPWACCDCDCSERLEERLASRGVDFLDCLRRRVRLKPDTRSLIPTSCSRPVPASLSLLRAPASALSGWRPSARRTSS